jgi:hypothetical protein
MSNLLIWSLENARKQTLSLVEDLRDEQMCLQNSKGENHPAWILGHLLLGDTYLLSMLKVQELSADFSGLLRKYGPNSNPNSMSENYDSIRYFAVPSPEPGFPYPDAGYIQEKSQVSCDAKAPRVSNALPVAEYEIGEGGEFRKGIQ